MPLMNKRKRRALRVFFTTDIHGSDRCFRKFLAAAATYDADVLLLGGDVVGKAMTPIEALPHGTYRYTLFGQSHVVSADELDGAKAAINFNGFYPAVVDAEGLEQMHEDEEHRHNRFLELIADQMRAWD